MAFLIGILAIALLALFWRYGEDIARDQVEEWEEPEYTDFQWPSRDWARSETEVR